jgi:hypothetical protein
MDWGPLDLGNGSYVFTIGAYRDLDVTAMTPSAFYDLLDRSYEFLVEGTPPLLDGVFRRSAKWTVDCGVAERSASGR